LLLLLLLLLVAGSGVHKINDLGNLLQTNPGLKSYQKWFVYLSGLANLSVFIAFRFCALLYIHILIYNLFCVSILIELIGWPTDQGQNKFKSILLSIAVNYWVLLIVKVLLILLLLLYMQPTYTFVSLIHICICSIKK